MKLANYHDGSHQFICGLKLDEFFLSQLEIHFKVLNTASLKKTKQKNNCKSHFNFVITTTPIRLINIKFPLGNKKKQKQKQKRQLRK